MTSTTHETRTTQGIYFFLSYAHSAPIRDDASDPDHWVKVFYGDLHRRVRQLATPAAGWEIGFIDDELLPDADWKAQLSRALGVAEVFVPLYSPAYLNRSWPLSERDAFEQRLRATRSRSTAGHVQPVLWIPVQSGVQHPELATARLLGADASAYAENGLRALCMLRSYQDQYTTVVDRLAREIVRVAEQYRLGPSDAPAPSGTSYPQTTETPFVIAVLAPTEDMVGPHRSTGWYGTAAVAWRPFGDAQARPLVDYAANVAERFGLPTRIVDFGVDNALFDKYPGLVFIDPWILEVPGGRERLRSAVRHLHEWATAVVITNHVDPEYDGRGEALATEVAGMLNYNEIGQTNGPRRFSHAREVEEFIQVMPTLVAQTRRMFLRHGPVFPPKGANTDPPWLLNDDASASCNNYRKKTMTENRNGQVVTFYSYKGGTGRTMALANVAWILAANGNRVLVVDWDLESPDFTVISRRSSTPRRWRRPVASSTSSRSTNGRPRRTTPAAASGGMKSTPRFVITPSPSIGHIFPKRAPSTFFPPAKITLTIRRRCLV